jgi:ring-1,2-phenylacetyl-CoA epoxidase subunit PaaC
MKIETAEQAMQNKTYHQSLVRWLYQLADDELSLGHRDSEWLGMCPDIEGDVAFSSVAQDEVGHAVFYFDLLHELGEPDPDKMAFERPSGQRYNAALVERDNGDWAYSVARHFLYDLFDDLRLEAMAESSYLPLKQGVAKIRREEFYHLLHMRTWFTRLGQAGGQAKERLERGVRAVWADLGDLFHFGPHEEELVETGIVAFGSHELKRRWEQRAKDALAEAGLDWPGEIPEPKQNGRLGEHGEDLNRLLSTMTEVYNLDPAARW